MKCPLCNLEGRIDTSRYVVDTSGEEPKLFNEMDVKCINVNCQNFNKVFATEKNPIKIG